MVVPDTHNNSAALFSLGDLDAAALTHGHSDSMRENSTIGIVIVLVSLLADSLHSNTQV
jgi:hypothetical protein